MKQDYYEILGISKAASSSEIKKAYRKNAIKYHPDKNPGDKTAEANFKKAAEAYEILSDPDKKSRYDQFGHNAFEGAGGKDFQMSNLANYITVINYEGGGYGNYVQGASTYGTAEFDLSTNIGGK